MATSVETLLVSIQADTTKLKSGLTQAQSSLKGLDATVRNTSSGFTQMTSKLKTLGMTLGLAFGAQKVVSFFKESTIAASNFNEAFSKVSVVFGQNAEDIQAWAKSSIDNFGMSERNALTAAGTFGNLFSAFGIGAEETKLYSKSLTELAVDLASFNDMTVDESLLALRSGLSGETEPLKRFGIALSDTRLKIEAMALGLIKSTSEALTPAAKSQAAYNLIMRDSTVAQGDYKRTAEGTANTMRRVSEKMDNAKVAIGQGLLPVFDLLLKIMEKGIIPAFQAVGNFLAKNTTLVTALVGALVAATTAFIAYKTIIVLTTKAKKIFAVMQVLVRRQQLATIASTNTLAASMLKLNAVMRANVFGIVVTAIAAVVAIFVVLWNKSEMFRKIVVTIAKGVLAAVALMIKAWGAYMTILVKIITGPLKLFLGVLSKLPGVGGAAKKGLELISKGTDLIGDVADKAAAKVTGLGDKLDGLVKKQEKAAAKTKEKVKTTVTGGLDPNAAKAAEKAAKEAEKNAEKLKDLAKDVIDIYADMNEVISEANLDAIAAAKDRDESIAEANKRYNETVTDLNKRYNEALSDAQQRYDDTEANARADYAKSLVDEAKNYAKKKIELEEKLQKTLTDLREKAAQKQIDLTRAAADKQQQILQAGADKLKSAFASGLGISLSDVFKKEGVSGVANALQAQLAGAKKLAKNAADLAGKGYSQQFIEEVVKNGPEVGNQMAEALLASSPEQQQILVDLYNSLDDISKTGVTQLASNLNNALNFSTQEQMDAYNEVSSTLKTALAETTATLNADLAQAQAEHSAALAEAQLASQERIAEAKVKLDETLADALKTLIKSRADAKKQLDEGLAEAAKVLADSLAETQKKYGEAIDKINADTEKKLAALKAKMAEVAAAMAALGAAQAAQAAMANVPVYVPAAGGSSGSGSTGITNNITTTVTGVNMTSPAATGQAVASQIQYGTTVNTTTLAGILAASNPKPVTTYTSSVNTNSLAGILAASGTPKTTTSTGMSGGSRGKGFLVE